MLLRNKETLNDSDVQWAELVLAAGGVSCYSSCMYSGDGNIVLLHDQAMVTSCAQHPRYCRRIRWW